ncbi:MAG: metal-sulfur cluster assembly factor [Deltaproteobacteria bacterium]|nr:metal-sulfur cluster assembly factor [Deltaproteobacteria bacterium]
MTDTPPTPATPNATDTATPTPAVAASAPTAVATGALPEPAQLLDAIRPVIDPEIGISVVDLGLIYQTRMVENNTAHVLMTLTSPMCPLGPEIMNGIHAAVATVPGVQEVKVELTFNPPWDPRTMANDDTKLLLGIF